MSAESSFVYLLQQSFLVVLHIFFRRLQHKLDFFLAEGTLEGGELIHLCFELLCIYQKSSKVPQSPILFITISFSLLHYVGSSSF